jgi:hypothetical protein
VSPLVGSLRRLRLRVIAPALLLVAAARLQAGPPEWLLNAAAAPVPELAGDVPAVVLLNEVAMTVDASGRASTVQRRAVKILTRAGDSEAFARVSYIDKTESVRGCDAWLVRGGKMVKPAFKREWIDTVESGNEAIYSEYRKRELDYRDDAMPGDIFGYETRCDGRLLFLQISDFWSEELPAVRDRFQLKIPSGWRAEAVLKGPLTPVCSVSADGRTTLWTVENSAYQPAEPWAPTRAVAQTHLMITLRPPDAGNDGRLRGFSNWADVVDWTERLNAPQCDTDLALTATARKLVADCPNYLAKIRAIGRYVQELRYVEVAKDLGIGFGYRARKATEVHAKGWGDCKDKANLLRAMLREVGIGSSLVVAHASEALEVLPGWPSPAQFDHMITAIEVDNTVFLPAVLPIPGGGRRLFFDPTSGDTVLGDLPAALQDSMVLLCAPGNEQLVRLPSTPFELGRRLERRVELLLCPDGSITGQCTIGGVGQTGAKVRSWLGTTAISDRPKGAGQRLNEALRGVSVSGVTSQDDRDSGTCFVSFSFSASSFVQFMPGGLALVRLDVLSRDSLPNFVERERRTPIQIPPLIQQDEVGLTLPPGFTVDELPPKTALAGPYGSYENSFVVAGPLLTRHRTLRFASEIVPASAYAGLQKFLADVAKIDRTAVILKRQRPAGG